MKKRFFVLAIIIVFVANAIPVFAGGGGKTAFQTMADPISEFSGKTAPPDKYESKGAFQTIANNISRIGKKSGATRQTPKNIFQSTSKSLSGFESWIKGEQSTYTGTPTGAFQEAKDYLDKHCATPTGMKVHSLRGRPDELARRRMGR